MQLPLGPDPRTETLQRTHDLLIAHFGRVIRPPEKRRDPVWVLVQGVIGARTKTIHSNRSADQLLAHFSSWEAVAAASEAELLRFLQTATFPELMAERLKACLMEIVERRGAVTLDHLHNLPTEEAMDWLESLPGVARKVSAGVMNASTFKRAALVIDTNHRRVIQRMGLVPAKADTAKAYDTLMPILPETWTPEHVDEHHLLVKRVGQRFCRPQERHCAAWPARPECRTGRVEDDGH
ncbi:endonuclease III domain-containing protein [Parasphingopyxis lamellibrachiae]|uniref:Endonuclease-3 n=1 Tax=Parasphingopyxis lamellibrachiae TaxID=680125 RepID=A0A3D9FFY4_9SPHN|nr:endonuclease III [Parasphingopyxis lamellibrachiae]RED16452.1 endonuclease-3 [Parasphingopyxis lamellibrachiae]